jgi:16S rRNA (guanine966-N2)-methyltransferase
MYADEFSYASRARDPMRIVGGKFAGWDLTSPADFRVRPTAERVRGALLTLLAPDLPGARVLDLFAGTGALGLEALSRGAAALVADRYRIAFADPPYGSRMLDLVLNSWRANAFSMILAVEHASDHELPRGSVRRVFDDSAFTIYRRNA